VFGAEHCLAGTTLAMLRAAEKEFPVQFKEKFISSQFNEINSSDELFYSSSSSLVQMIHTIWFHKRNEQFFLSLLVGPTNSKLKYLLSIITSYVETSLFMYTD
jgi:hypothetical protein